MMTGNKIAREKTPITCFFRGGDEGMSEKEREKRKLRKGEFSREMC